MYGNFGNTAADKLIFREHVETVTLKTSCQREGACKAVKAPPESKLKHGCVKGQHLLLQPFQANIEEN